MNQIIEPNNVEFIATIQPKDAEEITAEQLDSMFVDKWNNRISEAIDRLIPIVEGEGEIDFNDVPASFIKDCWLISRYCVQKHMAVTRSITEAVNFVPENTLNLHLELQTNG